MQVIIRKRYEAHSAICG